MHGPTRMFGLLQGNDDAFDLMDQFLGERPGLVCVVGHVIGQQY